jgi:hypothetical protein
MEVYRASYPFPYFLPIFQYQALTVTGRGFFFCANENKICFIAFFFLSYISVREIEALNKDI